MPDNELYRILRLLIELRQKAGLPSESYVGVSLRQIKALYADAVKGKFPEIMVVELKGPVENPKPMNPTSKVHREPNPNVIEVHHAGFRRAED